MVSFRELFYFLNVSSSCSGHWKLDPMELLNKIIQDYNQQIICLSIIARCFSAKVEYGHSKKFSPSSKLMMRDGSLVIIYLLKYSTIVQGRLTLTYKELQSTLVMAAIIVNNRLIGVQYLMKSMWWP